MCYWLSMGKCYFLRNNSSTCLTRSDLVVLVDWASLVSCMNCLEGIRTVSICSLDWLVLILVVFIWETEGS